jgi:hypothetical protein
MKARIWGMSAGMASRMLSIFLQFTMRGFDQVRRVACLHTRVDFVMAESFIELCLVWAGWSWVWLLIGRPAIC